MFSQASATNEETNFVRHRWLGPDGPGGRSKVRPAAGVAEAVRCTKRTLPALRTEFASEFL